MTCAKPFPSETSQPWPAVRRLAWIALAILLMLANAWTPRLAHAQATGKMWQIGVLLRDVRQDGLDSLIEGLREQGYVEGKNMVLHMKIYKSEEEMSRFVRELVALHPDVIVSGTGRGALALKDATTSLPIVVTSAGDAVGQGLAKSLAHPGGNVTGLTNMSADLAAKRLQLLREVTPQAKRVGVLGCPLDPNGITGRAEWSQVQPAAQTLGLQLVPVFIRQPEEAADELEKALRQKIQAVLILDCSLLPRREQVTAMVNKAGLPSMYVEAGFPRADGLMSYGPDRRDQYRRAAVFVGKILKGRKPADLPFEQPTKFELVINMKTAKALGLKISPVMMLRADRVIE
jgi:putative tryptophan/tyrosine transport system substrate-binding protein